MARRPEMNHNGHPMKSAAPLTCSACRQGHLQAATRTRTYSPRGQDVAVELLTSRCDQCGVESTRAAQHQQNLERLALRKQQYGGLLLGEEILALRKRYGLTQQDASKVFGKGKIAFSRYENETTYPDDSTTLLLQLAIDKPEVMKALADKAGIVLPLWAERCEDEQRLKVRPLLTIARAAQATPWHREMHYIAKGGSVELDSIPADVWATPMQRARQAPRVQDASNDRQVAVEAIAS